MPGVGVRTGARILVEVGDGSTFPTAGHLAAYAGLAPATRSSGSSIRGEQPARRGNKQLQRAIGHPRPATTSSAAHPHGHARRGMCPRSRPRRRTRTQPHGGSSSRSPQRRPGRWSPWSAQDSHVHSVSAPVSS
jgi:transposase